MRALGARAEWGAIMRLRRWFVVLLVVPMSLVAAGCTTQLKGTVVSATAGTPVSGAKVSVGTKSAVTTESGCFVLDGVALGKTALVVEAPGYPRKSLNLDVSSGATPLVVKLDDARLTGRVVEAAVEPKPVTDAVIRCGNTTAAVEPDGAFAVAGLPVGKLDVTVEIPAHETTTVALNLLAGSNTCTVTASLTATETYMRYYTAYKFCRYDFAYQYLHPDVRAKQSLSSYSKTMDGSGSTVSLTLGGTRLLPQWTSKYTKKTYSNVTEVDRTVVIDLGGAKSSDSMAQHWVKVDGIWLLVYVYSG